MARTIRPKLYDRYIAAIVKELGLEGVKIYWRAKLNKNIGGYAYPNEVYILKNMSTLETMRVLAHELRHVYQYKMGWLSETDADYWKGSTYKNVMIRRGIALQSYRDLPWEVDADEYAAQARADYYSKVFVRV